MTRMLHLAAAATLAVLVPVAALAQGAPVTPADVDRLQTNVLSAGADVRGLRATNAARADELQSELDLLAEEVIYLRVKLRREEPVARAEYTDVRDRIEALRSRARNEPPPTAAPAPAVVGAATAGTATNVVPAGTQIDVRIMTTLCRDKVIGKHVVPIVPDESRTFGMEGMFRQLGIYSPKGQLYKPEDADQLMFYKESKTGQVLQEGINEAGGMADWIAAATAYSVHGVPMIPFYIYYSMFGFQRVGDLCWAAGDSRARGFLLGGTAGRTTLNGEGLQHEDGHSHVLASTIPNCISYDPSFSYEVAVVVQHGLQRMFVEQEDVFFYLTVMNENYRHPDMPDGVEDGIKRGL
jgi:pyruvate dehydrogenase complex dehydrogenase (E1) component